jgi:phenylalanyl-tRNA synthetase beta chain
MGGERSEVQPTTTSVLMEAATWDGPNIQRTSSRVAIRTEASARFEKGLSPEATLEGQALAAKLMVEVCGATLVPGTVDVGGPGPEPRVVRLRDARTARLLGAEVPRADAAGILARLGFEVRDAPDGLDAAVPHWRRADVTREADLVEEVARVWGLEKLPATLPAHRGPGRLTPAQVRRRRLEDALVGAGVSETVGWSFAGAEQFERLGLGGPDGAVRVANPMSEEQAFLRTTLLGSLLDVVRHNQARGMDDVRVWELGAVYRDRPGEELPEERQSVAAVLAGRLRPASWREPEPPTADVFAAKGVLAAVLAAVRVPWEVVPAPEPFLHPGRSAAVLVGGERVGWLGELHPVIAGRWDLGTVAGFELDLGAVLDGAVAPAYEDLTSFPAVRQDLAVVVGAELPAARVLAIVREAGGKLLRSAEVFDVYRGAQVGEGASSLGLSLEFSAPDRTLTDEEVDRRRAKIVAALAREGAQLRG